MTFIKGQSGNPKGRPKGTRNRVSGSIADDILTAWERLGGVDWLVKVAQDDPKTAVSLLRTIVPRNIENHTTIETYERILEQLKAAS